VNCRYDCESEHAEVGKLDMLEMHSMSTTTAETLDLDADMEGSGDTNEPSLEVSPDDMEDVNIMRILDINNKATHYFVFRLILSRENGGSL
jgi:hypothetical protein